MKYFATVDKLFDFKYLLTEDELAQLSKNMRDNSIDLEISIPITRQQSSEKLTDVLEMSSRNQINEELCKYVISNCDKKEPIIIEKISNILVAVDIAKKINSNILITNSNIAAHLIGHIDFEDIESVDNLPGNVYHIGRIKDINIFVDPNMKWSDTKIFHYCKKDIKVATYIKSQEISIPENKAHSINNVICTYILNEKPLNIIDLI